MFRDLEFKDCGFRVQGCVLGVEGLRFQVGH